VLLPSQEFISILREMNDEVFTISSTDSGIKIVGSSAKFEFPSEDPSDFPELPEVEARQNFKMPAGHLAKMIRRTVFAAASENSRFHMCSVLVEIEQDGTVRFVATDGKRLALMPGRGAIEGKPDGQTSALVPPKAMSLLSKIVSDPEEQVEIALGTNEAAFRTARATAYTRLVEGRFPPWRTVVPPEPPIKIPVGVERFMSALRQAKIVTSMESRAVKFHFEDGTLVLRGQGADVGEAEVKMPVAFDKGSLEVTFDPDYLLEALRVLEPSEEVTLGLADAKRAATLHSGDEYTYVIMPVTRDG
jgi:DNA polymerase-3 subunit beta